MRIIDEYKPSAVMPEQAETITVIVAVYNIETYLTRCVRSILNQTYRKLQIILVDDGSTDSSGTICDKFAQEDARVEVLHKKNGGLSDARNAGIRVAKGTYLAFVDGDDWIDESMYEEMLGSILEQEADIAICRYRQVYPDQTIDESTKQAIVFEHREALECLIAEQDEYQLQNAAWNKLYRRDLLQGQEFPKGRWYEDIVYTTILLSKIKRCVYLDRAFYNYVLQREGSIMSYGLNARILTDQIPAYMEKTEFLRSIGEAAMADTHNYYTYKRLLILYTQFRRSKDKNRKKFCKELKQIIYAEQDYFEAAFTCTLANPNEYKKMKIFLKSTILYNVVMDVNDTFLIPYKQRKIQKKVDINHLHIVKLSGGLGNQMFQYALYRQLLAQGKRVKMDDVTEYTGSDTRPKQLQAAFGVTYECCSREELVALTDAYGDTVSRIRRKLFGRRTKSYMERQFNFDEKVLQQESAYYEGCWQTEKYFKKIEKEIREAFTFRCAIPEATQKFLKQIEAVESVGIHIRRGDYLYESQQAVYGNICTEAYYENAIRKMQERVPDAMYFIFTNDIIWAKERMQGKQFIIVDCNDESTGYLDMLLMSKCRHNIIANSSFSWWAAWLNQNPQKIVMAPTKWLNDKDCSDIYTDSILAI